MSSMQVPTSSRSEPVHIVTQCSLPKVTTGFSLGQAPVECATDREPYLRERVSLERLRTGLLKELRNADNPEEKKSLWHRIEAVNFEIDLTHDVERRVLLPEAFDHQVMGNQLFFRSPLFSVAHRRARSSHTTFNLGVVGSDSYHYEGPELRQDDALTFLTLLHVAQHFKPGTPVSFSVPDFCRSIGLKYCGTARMQVMESIKRLQSGFLCSATLRVQLIGRFKFASKGAWFVTLDPDILRFFQNKCEVWLDRDVLASLRKGIETWLYAYVRTHWKLIPTPVDDLKAKCGSTATTKNYRDSLLVALRSLAAAEVIDKGFFFDETGRVHWRKGPAADRASVKR